MRGSRLQLTVPPHVDKMQEKEHADKMQEKETGS